MKSDKHNLVNAGGGNIVCPVCESDYINHKTATIAMLGQDESGDMKRPTRGNVIVIPFVGECGHEYSTMFINDKGQCRFETVITK
jgi:hypothetical protein